MFPTFLVGVSGLILNESLVICSGATPVFMNASYECFRLLATQDKFEKLPLTLKSQSFYGASASLNDSTFVSFGGLSQNATEIVNIFEAQTTLEQALPKNLFRFCVVELDKSNLLLIGGRTENSIEKSIYSFNIGNPLAF